MCISQICETENGQDIERERKREERERERERESERDALLCDIL